MRVIYEDNHLLAVWKPAGLATMGALAGKPTALEEAKRYVKQKHAKPGAVYLGVVSRLDAPVTGLLLLARTSKAASRLTAAFAGRDVDKRYLATVAAPPPADSGRLEHHLRKDDAARRVHATRAGAEGAKLAVTAYRVLANAPGQTLLEARPETGRKHQIRVQLAKAGSPILGDAKYGGTPWRGDGIALHAWRLRLEHPVRRTPLVLEAPPDAGWAGWTGPQLAAALALVDGGEAS